MISKEIKKEIDEICDAFVEKVGDISELSPYSHSRLSHSSFPIFEIGNKEFYEYSYYEKYMEAAIRDEVVKPIIGLLFHDKGVETEWPDRDHFYVNYSNECIERIYPFEFRIREGNSTVGVRYTGISEEDYDFKRIIRDHKIDKVLVVRWEENCKYRTDSKRIKVLTALEFLETYFDSDSSEYVIEKIKKAVGRANDEVGFQTIPMLSLRNLSSFKDERMEGFSTIDYGNMRYQIVENSKVRDWLDFSLPKEDIRILNDIFVDNELFRVFDGRNKFSRSFMTSEYLYSIFKEGNSFDYTSVVTGYLKSVEQLIHEIVMAELKLRPSGKVFMKRKTCKFKHYEYVKTISIKRPETGAWHVPFLPKNEKYFDISLAPLIWLLHDHVDIWRLSQSAREMIHKVLIKYSQECRNDHFHKDNIDDFQSVICIRNNTILMFYLLIGGCKLSNDKVKTEEILGVDKESFSEICKKLYRIPRSQNRYVFQYGNDEIKAMRLYDQQRPIYDSNGSLRDTIIEFVKVDEYEIEDYKTFLQSVREDQRIQLSRENMPDKIWLVLRDGERREI